MLPAFTLVRAATIEEGLEAISEGAVPYAGGTELLLAMRTGLLRPRTLVDLKRLPDLAAIELADGFVRIGATATHVAIAKSRAVNEHAPLLAHVEGLVGNPRVRAQGTIGGNVCFAEPKSDVTTALVALDARMRLTSHREVRTMSAADFLESAYSTNRREDELLTAVEVPARSRPASYVKYQTRERPTVGVAVTSESDGSACLVVVGAVSEGPVAFQAGTLDAVDPEGIAEGIDPIPDLAGSERYKRHVTAVFVERAVQQLKRELDERH